MRNLIILLAFILGACKMRPESGAQTAPVTPSPRPKLIDAKNGVWFPPAKSYESYANEGSPSYQYTSDISDVYKNNPTQMENVCSEALLFQGKPSSPMTREQQFHGWLYGWCLGAGIDPRSREERRKRYPSDRDKFFKLVDREIEGARTIPPEQQEEEYRKLSKNFYSSYDNQLPSRHALHMFALRPDASDSVAYLMQYSGELNIFINSDDARAAVGDYLKSKGNKSGYRFYLLYSGDYPAARKLTTELATENPRNGYERVIGGVIDRLQGDRKPLDEAVKDCPKPTPKTIEEFYGITDPKSHCRSWVSQILLDGTPVVRDSSAKIDPWRDLLVEYANCDIPIVAVNTARRLLTLDEAEGVAALRKLVTRDLPSGIRLDAYTALLTISAHRANAQDAERWANCWTTFVGANRQFRADTWAKLKKMPLVDRPPNPEPTDAIQVGHKYLDAVQAAASSHDFARAEAAAEAGAAFQVEEGAYAEVAREALLWLADAEAKTGRSQEATRILGYLGGQPLGRATQAMGGAVRQTLRGVVVPGNQDAPWPQSHGGWKPISSNQCR